MIRPDLSDLLERMRDIRFVRYLLASGGALAVDVGSFLALLSLGGSALAASACGYSLGIVAHWLMSSRAVFHHNVAAHGLARARQKALFVVSALIGLALTTAIVVLGERAGIDPRIAKGLAVAASFTVTWLLRNQFVFRASLAAGGRA